MTKKSIIIDEKAHTELGKLSESLRMNLGALIQEMIYYFKKTGIDPKDAVNKDPSLMVAALDKRIVSFLKVQERDILKPLRQDIFNYQNAQKEEISKLIISINKLLEQHSERTTEIKKAHFENLNKINSNDVERVKMVVAELQKNRQAILLLCQLLDDKNKSGTLSKIKSLFFIMPISKPHSTLGADNKGSCSNLAIYLEKENEELDKLIKKSSLMNEIFKLENMKQGFFTASEINISTIDVISSIDNNKRKLGANDAKYFAPTISFSENELSHIAFLATGKREVTSVLELNSSELEQFNNLIREYGRKAMDNYALNFNRQDKGIKTGADLVYFGKIEHFRKFKGTDKEVVDGKEISGQYKKGLQSHIHIIVSRKDKTQQLKLSPTCNEKRTNRKIGNNEYQVGFDRVKWINSNEKIFDEHFNYKRKELEKFQNQNILKNGSPQDKHEINKKIELESINIGDIKKQIVNAHFNVLMIKPKNLKEYQERMIKFAIQVLPIINKGGFIQENHFFHEQSGIDFKEGEVDQNLKLHELFSADNKIDNQMKQTEQSLADWQINTEKLASILLSPSFEIDPRVDDELLKRKRKRAIKR